MTYLNNDRNFSAFFDNTESKALTGDLSLFQTSINSKCFYSSDVTHVEGRQLIHIGSMMTNDSDTASFLARISLRSDLNRLGTLMSHKQASGGSSTLSMQSTQSSVSLTSVAGDTGDALSIGNLNFISISLK